MDQSSHEIFFLIILFSIIEQKIMFLINYLKKKKKVLPIVFPSKTTMHGVSLPQFSEDSNHQLFWWFPHLHLLTTINTAKGCLLPSTKNWEKNSKFGHRYYWKLQHKARVQITSNFRSFPTSWAYMTQAGEGENQSNVG